MEFYYIINYYFKYLELFDTIFLVLKKKPLRKYAVSMIKASVIDLLQLHRISPCLSSFRDGFIMFHAAQRKNQHCQYSDSRSYSSHLQSFQSWSVISLNLAVHVVMCKGHVLFIITVLIYL